MVKGSDWDERGPTDITHLGVNLPMERVHEEKGVARSIVRYCYTRVKRVTHPAGMELSRSTSISPP